MAFSRMDEDVEVVSRLDDEPNDVGGMTPAELKVAFDAAAVMLKYYLNNTLVPELEAGSAAANIGVHVDGITGGNLAEALANLKTQLDDAVIRNTLTQNSINNSDMLLDLVVTAAKVAFNYAGSSEKGGAANSVAHPLLFGGKSYDGSAGQTMTLEDLGGLPGATKYAGSSSQGGAANSVQANVEFNDSGLGGEAGTSFNGSSAKVVSYNTVGAQRRNRIVNISLWSGATQWDVPVSGLKSGTPLDQSVDWSATTDAGYVLCQNCNIRAVNPNPTADYIRFKADSAPSDNITIALRIWD